MAHATPGPLARQKLWQAPGVYEGRCWVYAALQRPIHRCPPHLGRLRNLSGLPL